MPDRFSENRITYIDWPAPFAGNNTFASAVVDIHDGVPTYSNYPIIGEQVVTTLTIEPASLGSVTASEVWSPSPPFAGLSLCVAGRNGLNFVLTDETTVGMPNVYCDGTDTYFMVNCVAIASTRYVPPTFGNLDAPRLRYTNNHLTTTGLTYMDMRTGAHPPMEIVNPGETWPECTYVYKLAGGAYSKTPAFGAELIGQSMAYSESGTVNIQRLPAARALTTLSTVPSTQYRGRAWIAGTDRQGTGSVREYTCQTVAGSDTGLVRLVDNWTTDRGAITAKTGLTGIAPTNKYQTLTRTATGAAYSVTYDIIYLPQPFSTNARAEATFDYEAAGVVPMVLDVGAVFTFTNNVDTIVMQTTGAFPYFTQVSTTGPNVVGYWIDGDGYWLVAFDANVANVNGDLYANVSGTYTEPDIIGRNVSGVNEITMELRVRCLEIDANYFGGQGESFIANGSGTYDGTQSSNSSMTWSHEDIAHMATYQGGSADGADTDLQAYIGAADNRIVIHRGARINKTSSPSEYKLPACITSLSPPSGYEENDVLRPAGLSPAWVALRGGGTIPAALDQWWDGIGGPGRPPWSVGDGTFITWQYPCYGADLVEPPSTVFRAPKWDAGTGSVIFEIRPASAWLYRHDTPSAISIPQQNAFTLPYPYAVPRFLGSTDYVRVEGYIPTALKTIQTAEGMPWSKIRGTPHGLTLSAITASSLSLKINIPTGYLTGYWIRHTTPDLDRAMSFEVSPIWNAQENQPGIVMGSNLFIIVSDDTGRFLDPSTTTAVSYWSKFGPKSSFTAAGHGAWASGAQTLRIPAGASVVTIDLVAEIRYYNPYAAIPLTTRLHRTWVCDLVAGTSTMTRDTFPA